LLELLTLVLFFGPIIAVCMVFDDWLEPITGLEPGTFPFAVFRLVELAAGFGFVYASWRRTRGKAPVPVSADRRSVGLKYSVAFSAVLAVSVKPNC
jgi:hypothetical protein